MGTTASVLQWMGLRQRVTEYLSQGFEPGHSGCRAHTAMLCCFITELKENQDKARLTGQGSQLQALQTGLAWAGKKGDKIYAVTSPSCGGG